MVANFLAAAPPSTSWPLFSARDSWSSTSGSPAPPPDDRAGVPAVTYLGRRIRAGTDDLSVGPAMSRDEALQAIGVGLAVADALAADGVELLGIGEMGIGNTTAASAIVAAMTGVRPGVVTGRGTGLDDAGRARKIATIERALARQRAPTATIRSGVLAAVGGLEIAALCGLIIGAAAAAHPGRARRVHHRRGGAAGERPRPRPAAAAVRRPSLGGAGPRRRPRPALARPAARPRPAARRGDRRGAGDGHRHGRGPAPRRDGDVRGSAAVSGPG